MCRVVERLVRHDARAQEDDLAGPAAREPAPRRHARPRRAAAQQETQAGNSPLYTMYYIPMYQQYDRNFTHCKRVFLFNGVKIDLHTKIKIASCKSHCHLERITIH